MKTINYMHGNILDVERCVENRLGDTLDSVKMEIGEIRESTNIIVDSIESRTFIEREVGSPRLPTTQRWTQARQRQCNLMIFGHLENKTEYSVEVADILGHLGVNVKTGDYQVTVMKTSHSDGKIILKVEFDNPTPVCIAMSNARRLKSFDKYEVYVANDLTYQERARLRIRVQELKVKIVQQPDITGPLEKIKSFHLDPEGLSIKDQSRLIMKLAIQTVMFK